MSQNKRRRTIQSNGAITDAPYGPSRWSTPKHYTCTHQDCPNPATALKAANAHPGTAPATAAPNRDNSTPAATTNKAHNCCGSH